MGKQKRKIIGGISPDFAGSQVAGNNFYTTKESFAQIFTPVEGDLPHVEVAGVQSVTLQLGILFFQFNGLWMKMEKSWWSPRDQTGF